MSAPSPHAAVFLKLREYTPLTALLPEGQGSIVPVGYPVGSKPYPFVTIAHSGEAGGPISHHVQTTIRVRCYMGTELSSFVEIEAALVQIKAALHKADLGAIDNHAFLDCRWTGQGSGDLYDYNNEAWYRELRFFVQTGYNL